MYKSKSLRRMPPLTRKFAKSLNDAERSITRMKKLVSAIQDTEKECLAWIKRQEYYKNNQKEVDHLQNWVDDSMLSNISKERSK